MAFTDEDRNVLIEAATKVKNIEGWMANLPCQQVPPVCTQEKRIANLETSRERGIKGVVAIGIGSVLTFIGIYIRHLFQSGG